MALNVKFGKESFINSIKIARESEGENVLSFSFNKMRCRILSPNDEVKSDGKGVLYWMSRDCRVQDNWAMLFAQRLALKNNMPLYVCFFFNDNTCTKELYPTRRQVKFLIDGLKYVKKECEELNIPFYLIKSSAALELTNVVKANNLGAVVSDFSPLKTPVQWKKEILKNLPKHVPLIEVDAHNIVPCWIASHKQEIGARTLRPKINKKLDEYLTNFPHVCKHPYYEKIQINNHQVNFDEIIDNFKPDHVKEIDWARPGPDAGLEVLHIFISEKLKHYAQDSSDPSKEALSNLSPWLHFGHISAQRCALVINNLKEDKSSKEKFLEELIVRRELSDNFCYYNPLYNKLEGADSWAQNTLNDHKKDIRFYVYTKEQFEKGETHDDIWNCAQLQLLQEGKIHGYMRMYWCKKILEWTETPEKAIEIALYLNDTYSLDGSDPNGFVGVMWSICGVHDHGWKERDIFGKIRYMVDYSLRNKFDIDSYCTKYGRNLPKNGKNKRGQKRKATKV